MPFKALLNKVSMAVEVRVSYEKPAIASVTSFKFEYDNLRKFM